MAKRIVWTISVLIGIAATILIFKHYVGFHELFQTLKQVGPAGIVIFVANSTLILFTPGLSWWLLMRGEGIDVSFPVALRSQWMGYPVNFTTPSMYLGGDAVKTIYISRICSVPKRRVLATIIVAKFQEFTGWFFSLIIGTVVLIGTTDVLKHNVENILLAVMAGLVLLYGAIFYSFMGNFKFTVKAIYFLARLRFLRRRMARLRNHADEMEEMVHAAFTKRLGRYIASQAITLVAAASVFFRPWIFFAFLPASGANFEYLITTTVLTNLVNALGIIPGGLGIFDGTMTYQAKKAGIGPEYGAAYAVVNRISDITLFIIGSALIFYYGLKKFFGGVDETTMGKETSATSVTPSDRGNTGPG